MPVGNIQRLWILINSRTSLSKKIRSENADATSPDLALLDRVHWRAQWATPVLKNSNCNNNKSSSPGLQFQSRPSPNSRLTVSKSDLISSQPHWTSACSQVVRLSGTVLARGDQSTPADFKDVTKKLSKSHIFQVLVHSPLSNGSSISIQHPPGSWEQPLCARCTNYARRRSRKVDEENISGRVVKAPHPIWYKREKYKR